MTRQLPYLILAGVIATVAVVSFGLPVWVVLLLGLVVACPLLMSGMHGGGGHGGHGGTDRSDAPDTRDVPADRERDSSHGRRPWSS